MVSSNSEGVEDYVTTSNCEDESCIWWVDVSAAFELYDFSL